MAFNFNQCSQSNLVSPQARSRLALIYPWGDEAVVLPRETRLTRNQGNQQLDNAFKQELDDLYDGENVPLEEAEENALCRPQRKSPSWLPQPLGNYEKWTRNPPVALVRGNLRLPSGLQPIAPEKLEEISLDEINDHAASVSLKL